MTSNNTYFQQLLQACQLSFTPAELAKLEQAMAYLTTATEKVQRASGEAYTDHPLKVALIAKNDMSMGYTAVLAALFHDSVQDDIIHIDYLQKKFGPEVCTLLQGLNKISSLYTEKLSLNSENFISFILTITNDVRAVLLKLADRLENIRSIKKFQADKQLKIAQETRLLYAPIAHRLGLYHIKTELEDISLRHTDDKAYFEIAAKLKDTKEQRENYIQKFSEPIRKSLDAKNISYEIKGRPKSVNSIYGKLTKKKIDISEIFDLFAIRIIIKNVKREDEKEACWNVYSLVTNIYNPNPVRLRDWVSTPRPSGYESLHTTVSGPDNRWVEIQIRTERMDEIAEKGNAAHWKYKESKTTGNHEDWLRNIREALEENNEEAIDQVNKKTELKDIFIFTPHGDIKKLREGSTILDFAYAVHTNVGDSCTGARVNEKIVPIKYKLQNGDTVEILTSKNQRPRQEWLSIVASPRTRTRIKRSINEFAFKQAEIGKEILERKMSQLKIDYEDQIVLKMVSRFKYKQALDFYQDIAEGKIDLQQIKEYLTDSQQEPEQAAPEIQTTSEFVHKHEDSDNFLIIDDSLVDVDYQLAKCCRPIPGDEIFGFVTVDRGIQVHRKNCSNAPDMLKRYPYRVVQTRWTDQNKNGSFMVEIVVTGLDKMGILNYISEVISKDHSVNMRSLAVNTKDGVFQGFIALFVNDLNHLDTLLANINRIKGVLKAERLIKK